MLLRFVMLCRFEINCYVTVPTLLLFAFVNLWGQMRKPNNKTEVQVWRLFTPSFYQSAVAYHSNIPVSKDLFQLLICANK